MIKKRQPNLLTKRLRRPRGVTSRGRQHYKQTRYRPKKLVWHRIPEYYGYGKRSSLRRLRFASARKRTGIRTLKRQPYYLGFKKRPIWRLKKIASQLHKVGMKQLFKKFTRLLRKQLHANKAKVQSKNDFKAFKTRGSDENYINSSNQIWIRGRRKMNLKIWDYREQNRFRRSSAPENLNNLFARRGFSETIFNYMSKIRYLQKFLAYKHYVKFYRQQFIRGRKLVQGIKARFLYWFSFVNLRYNRSIKQVNFINHYSSLRNKLILHRCSRLFRQFTGPSRFSVNRKQVFKIRSIISLLTAPSFIQSVLKFNYQVRYVLYPEVYNHVRALSLFGSDSRGILPSSIVDGAYLNNRLFSKTKKNIENDWESFWSKFRTFKWFFEYRRWRRGYQLAMWFRRLRSYRRIKKDPFYLRLLRLYFYYLGDISENAIVQAWRKFRRLDNRYQFTGLRFFQMLQMRSANLLVFMGLAANSVAGQEAARLGLVRINGFTKTNAYALVMAGDMLQFNTDIAFDYLTLFSDLYWVKVEAQSNFVGFVQVLFSLMLFLVLRWPRKYELSETDSRFSTRMISQIIRLFPVRILAYNKIDRIGRSYERHQNIVKMMPYKYRRSRRQLTPMVLEN